MHAERNRVIGLKIFSAWCRFMMAILILFFLYLAFTWCMGNVGSKEWTTPPHLASYALSFGLHQNWGMFAPRPPSANSWFIIEARPKSGSTVELLGGEGGLLEMNGRPFTYAAPTPLKDYIFNHRWFKLYEAMQGHPELRGAFLKYLCKLSKKKKKGFLEFKLWTVVQGYNPAGHRQTPNHHLTDTWTCE